MARGQPGGAAAGAGDGAVGGSGGGGGPGAAAGGGGPGRGELGGSGAPALLVAMAGGHLTQLVTLLDRLPLDGRTALWVTVDTAQSRSLLAGREVLYVPYAQPKDARAGLAHARAAGRLLGGRDFSVVVSTGSALAVPFLAAAVLRGIPCHFIDSATRVQGPSLTGRLVRRLPGVHLYAQYRSWAAPPWRYGGSVFDGYQAVGSEAAPRLRRAVVTLGSAEGYGFRRLVSRLAAVVPRGCEVLWQTGATDVGGLGLQARPSVAEAELRSAVAGSDVVVAHAGVGAALTALQEGRCPVLVPRLARHGEHVDDHQREIAADLAARGLAVTCDADELELSHLLGAAARRVTRAVPVPPFGVSLPWPG